MNVKEWKTKLFGRDLIVQYGKVAKQSSGSIWLQFGESVVLATVNISDRVIEGIDFVPLTVEYQEKFYAAGKIPGGFIKREGKPTESGILSARLIDRPIRPLFPKYLRNDVQLIVTVLSVDNDAPPDVAGIIAASLALNLSKIPFDGIVAGVRVGYVDGEFVIFPTETQLEKSKLDIVVAGSEEAITMVEGEAKEISEEEMVRALMVAHEAIKKIVDFEKEILKEFDVEKITIEEPKPLEEVIKKFEETLNVQELRQRLLVKEKLERSKKLNEYRDVVIENILNDIELEEDEKKLQESLLKELFDEKAKKLMRKIIIEEGIRADGRRPEDIRPITCELGLLPRAHGSALFTRGETQSLGIVTLGAPMEEQIVDTIMEEGTKRFILHYNFPPFSVGEVKPLRGPGRREIGHGHLAERALKAVVPDEDDYPYVVRVVSEILESNGSSSMATVCSGSLALMDAGVPIRTHVAGVAMGLIIEDDKAVILTDIQGLEDHWGDMDFKVAGTRNGITAFQMDCKVAGVGEELLNKALNQAKEARMKILDKLFETIEKPRENLSPHAPLIVTIHIDPTKVGDLIGPGGKVIKAIIKDYDVEISIDDVTGKVSIYGKDQGKVNDAVEYIKNITQEIEVGNEYTGKIIRIEPYGLFVEILPGKIGLAHVSKLGEDSKVFTKKYKVGDVIKVEVINIDEVGRIQLGKSKS
ncbi:polyribonucleotide nucleotidyltransferase [Thermosipho ferrireducens]|uniref:Polyribonucleotide nucleotidyltransferase n=1 Tax=Thermosipho ferrireducens TaxID=2571116 RepID=A0ABX7S8N0_9BACT|nr:polyribonucleotide nucleotidyltransferase [Thermosipho ferrireducens]QTA38953.1 polyribonucleotide nucleotidyltransferase [Thermosipho ferrireducens]